MTLSKNSKISKISKVPKISKVSSANKLGTHLDRSDCWYMNPQYVQSLWNNARWYKLKRSPLRISFTHLYIFNQYFVKKWLNELAMHRNSFNLESLLRIYQCTAVSIVRSIFTSFCSCFTSNEGFPSGIWTLIPFWWRKWIAFQNLKMANYVFNEKKLTTGGKGKPVIFVPCISNVSATCENDKLYISMCSARGTLKSIQYITRIYFYVFSHLSIFSRFNHCWTMLHVGTIVNRNFYAWSRSQPIILRLWLCQPIRCFDFINLLNIDPLWYSCDHFCFSKCGIWNVKVDQNFEPTTLK